MDNALVEVKNLLVRSGYNDNRTLEYIDCNKDDPDDMQRWNELMDASKALMQVVNNLGYIHCPFAGTSRLHLNASGRYENDFNEYTSGSGIEFLLADIAAHHAGCVPALKLMAMANTISLGTGVSIWTARKRELENKEYC